MKQNICRRDRWLACLVQAELVLHSLHIGVEVPLTEARWPARLVQGGALLIGVSTAALIIWLRQHL
jgi:hypothetical protein